MTTSEMKGVRINIQQAQKLQNSNNNNNSGGNRMYILFLVVASIGSSVSLILLNKVVMATYKFKYVLTISALHFLVTAIFARIAAHFRVFEPKRHSIPLDTLLTMAVAGCLSIAFMNFSLQVNSVGFYQMTKLMCIPYMVAFTRLVGGGSKVSFELLFSLMLILVGVGVATVTDITTTQLGFIYAFIAVVSTAQFQIWQGSKQAEYQLNALQITDIVMPYQFMVCFLFAMFEIRYSGTTFYEVLFEGGWSLLFALFMTCVMAVAVNIVTYALIGKTSAVTYQVVGHFKTCLTLLGGYLLFEESKRAASFMNVFGILVALFGMYLYGDAKSSSGGGSTFLSRHFPAQTSLWKKQF